MGVWLGIRIGSTRFIVEASAPFTTVGPPVLSFRYESKTLYALQANGNKHMQRYRRRTGRSIMVLRWVSGGCSVVNRIIY